MGLAYLFALIVALGILLVQIIAGGRDAAHHAIGQFTVVDADAHATHGPDVDGEPAFWTLFLSLRFWTFFALGFGLSGSLISFFELAPPIVTVLIAGIAGLGSGVFASIAFRLVRKTAATTEARASQAVGRVARVVVPCGRSVTGQVRVELAGGSVDLLATTEDEAIPKGEAVLVEDVRENVARVSRRPAELS